MTDKIVTHADLPVLRRLRDGSIIPSDLDFLDRLIAAAEADQQPLPEGWVLLVGEDGGLYPYWHMADRLYGGKGGDAYRIEATATKLRDRLTPLRPAVTEADVEKVAYAIFREHDKIGVPFDGTARQVSLNAAQAALRALDIEVRNV